MAQLVSFENHFDTRKVLARFEAIPLKTSFEQCVAIVNEFVRVGGNLNKRIRDRYMTSWHESSLVASTRLSSNVRKAIQLHTSIDFMAIAQCRTSLDGHVILRSSLLCILDDCLIVTHRWLATLPLAFFFAKPGETIPVLHKIYESESVFECLVRGEFSAHRELRNLLWKHLRHSSHFEEIRSLWVLNTLKAENDWNNLSFSSSCEILKALCIILRHAHVLDDKFLQQCCMIYTIISEFVLPVVTPLIQSYLEMFELQTPLLIPLIERRITTLQTKAAKIGVRVIVKRLYKNERSFTISTSHSLKRVTITTDW